MKISKIAVLLLMLLISSTVCMAEEEIAEEKEVSICLPEQKAQRCTVYMDMPDAQIRVEVEKVLPWVAFNSIDILDASFTEK